jgi:hypothetical protein
MAVSSGGRDTGSAPFGFPSPTCFGERSARALAPARHHRIHNTSNTKDLTG